MECKYPSLSLNVTALSGDQTRFLNAVNKSDVETYTLCVIVIELSFSYYRVIEIQ